MCTVGALLLGCMLLDRLADANWSLLDLTLSLLVQ